MAVVIGHALWICWTVYGKCASFHFELSKSSPLYKKSNARARVQETKVKSCRTNKKVMFYIFKRLLPDFVVRFCLFVGGICIYYYIYGTEL